MARTVYLNFNDLKGETQLEIQSMAEEEIRNDEEEMADIKEMYPDRVDEIVTERAERRLYQFDYVFNVQ